MGKAAKWFRGLLGLKTTDSNHRHAQTKPPPKKKWSFAVSNKEADRYKSQHDVVPVPEDDNEASRHAIAVATATAAVAEAAVAAAHAAAAVVHLTSSGRNISTAACVRYGSREEWAAVAIQSHFRAYLVSSVRLHTFHAVTVTVRFYPSSLVKIRPWPMGKMGFYSLFPVIDEIEMHV